MTELIQGPILPWEPGEANRATINRLLTSDDSLDQAYGETYSQGLFITEFGSPRPGGGIAAAGELSMLQEMDFRCGTESDPQRLTMGECITLGAYPAADPNRAERVRKAVQLALDARQSA